MERVVQKFGGTSVGSLDRIRHVAKLIAESSRTQKNIVVVSAMAGQTNRLVEMAEELSEKPQLQAYDMLLASGEQISCALLSMALYDLGIKSIPLLGYQVGIKTNALFSNARIQEINVDYLNTILADGCVPVIAGFQGVDSEGHITTLGRGGSDTSAVAIAAAIHAHRCDIYTDVDGVYTADPRYVPQARRLDYITFSEMMELASLGAKVLHMRSVELAAKYQLSLRVRSTFKPDDLGTLLVKDSWYMEEKMLESPVVSALTSDGGHSVIHVRLPSASDIARYPARLFKPLAEAAINVDIIIEGPPDNQGQSHIHFSIPREEGPRAKEILAAYQPQLTLENAVKISIVGIGMRTHSGVAAKFFEIFEQQQVPIHLVTTSEITVSVLVDEKFKEKMMLALHEGFHLNRS